jgi:hypothetical protein
MRAFRSFAVDPRGRLDNTDWHFEAQFYLQLFRTFLALP